MPNERPDASTTKIVVQFPENVSSASFQPVEGWTRTIQMIDLETPLTDEDGNEITERIDTVTWEGGEIKPGEFQEFGVSFQVPDTPGERIAFPAVQTYSSGETVRWIGDEEADEPAPAITVLAAAGEEEAAPPETTASEPTDTTARDARARARRARTRGRSRGARPRARPRPRDNRLGHRSRPGPDAVRGRP